MRKKIRINSEGFVVVLALIALMAMSFFLMTGAATTTSTMKVSGNYSKTIDSFNHAEVGIAKARPIVEATDFNTLLASTTLIAETPWHDGFYTVEVEDNEDSPDEDGNPATDADGIIIVRSIGRNVTGGTVQIEAHMQKVTIDGDEPFPGEPGGGAGAALMCGTSTDVKAQGSSTISGEDYSIPELPDCSGKAGCAGTNCTDPVNVGTPDCDAMCGIGLSCPGGFAAVGEGEINTSGGGDIIGGINENQPDTECDEWRTLRDQLASLDDSDPDVVMLTETDSPITDPVNDCDDPKVFIINSTSSTFQFSGSAELCGIVVVSSATSVAATGNVVIVGLVMVMGESADLQIVASKGTPRIFGQVIVESNTVDKAKEMSVAGNAEVLYSTQGIGFANDAMNDVLSGDDGGGGGLLTMAWKETY